VRERLDVRPVDAETFDPRQHSLGLLGCARQLRGSDAAVDYADDVGKRASYIDSYAQCPSQVSRP
jgi:hypothetical protein